MKTTALTLIAVGVVAAATAFGASGHAHAETCTPHTFTPECDQQYYLGDLRNDGVVPDSQATQTALIQLGYATCNAREHGMTDSQIVASITGGSISPDKAEWIVIDAGMNLC